MWNNSWSTVIHNINTDKNLKRAFFVCNDRQFVIARNCWKKNMEYVASLKKKKKKKKRLTFDLTKIN